MRPLTASIARRLTTESKQRLRQIELDQVPAILEIMYKCIEEAAQDGEDSCTMIEPEDKYTPGGVHAALCVLVHEQGFEFSFMPDGQTLVCWGEKGSAGGPENLDRILENN
jgi:hypothetical protein